MAISNAGTRDSVQSGNYIPSTGTNKFASSYETTSGILVLPLAEESSSGVPVEFVRVHQPIRKRIYQFHETKRQTPPLIPAPEDNAKEYLLSSTMTFPVPSIAADKSSLIWSAMGQMEFIEKGSWSISTGYRIGRYPFETPSAYLLALGALAGGAALVASETDTVGETLANGLNGFPSSPEYAFSAYDYAPHFPSRFMVADLALGN